MSKKEVTFIIGLTIIMGVLWVLGEIVMGIWIAVGMGIHIAWGVGIVAVTLAVSVWHSMKEDKSGLVDPKREKYQRKLEKRKK